jgi:predicted Zn-dependent protease
MRPEIDLIPMDDIDEKVVSDLKALLKERGCIVRMYSRAHSPKTSINLYRKQNNVDIVADALGDLSGKVVAVTDKDLYTNKLNFTFHHAEKNGPTVISTFRLRPEFYQERPSNYALMDRLLKETIFCIGKMNGMKECPNSKCIMHKSASARDIDTKSIEFCQDCKINNVIDTRL